MTTEHNAPGRSRSGRFSRNIVTSQRDGQAALMRARGSSYSDIASSLGFSARSGAYAAVERALAATVQEGAAELRQLQLLTLDALQVEAWKVLDRKHLVVSAGKVIVVDGEPLLDSAPTLRSVDTILRLCERRAKLMGLDAPQRHEITAGDLDAEITRLTAQLAEND